MGFVLTEDQELIRKTARSFVQERLPIGHLRKLRDAKDPDGFSRDHWKELAGSGLVGIAFPEQYGGGGLGYAELGLVMEELGRTLAPTPFVSTILLSGNAILAGGSETQKAEHLPPICAGDRIVAFAHEEGTRFAPYRIATHATATAHGFHLTGEKSFVLDGHIADELIVVARTSGADTDRDGLSLFLVPARAKGISIARLSAVDCRNVSRVGLAEVDVPAAALIGQVGKGADVLDTVLDRASVGLAAEMLGSALEAFDQTVAYLKVRKQFGAVIGSFQALKHRAANMFCELELGKSVVLDSLRALDEGRPDAAALASLAKARLNDTYLLVASEAIQLHGGIGVTDELDIGFFYKRARTSELTFGNSAFHRDRFARLSGY